MNYKRKLAFLLVIVMLFTLYPASVFAYPNNPADFKLYLDANGFISETDKGELANFDTYERYGFVVYGKPYGEELYSRETGLNERRYLGYTDKDQPYTNSKFPNDARGIKTPLLWVHTPVLKADSSWTDVTDTDQKTFMLSDNLQFEGIVYNGLNVNWIGQTKAKLLNKASFKNGFSVLTEHKGADGKTYYATYYGQEMGGDTHIDCEVSTPVNTYTIKADQQSVTVPVTVKATADLDGEYVKVSHIKSLTASFKDKTSPAVGNILTASVKKNYILSRTDYKPGTHTVPLLGSGEMVSTLSGSDKYYQQASKTITLIVEDYPNAYVEVTATANPSKKQVDGSKDELVTVTVNAALRGYTDITNIKSWTIFAKLDGEDLTLQQKDNLGGILTSSASFNFTVAKSKFNVDSFLQSFKVTALVNLNRPINGIPPYQGTAYTTSEFYKVAPEPEDPPTGGNLPPIAVLSCEETVKAGEETGIDGLSSYDTDGYIASYNMNTTGATVTDSGDGWRNVWYPYSGQPTKTYKASVRAVDNMGAADADSKFITVTEPTVNAKIKVEGKLKVNRSVKIINTSKSPTHYPIDINKTVWTLQAVSGGTNADIKFNGVLNKVNEINVIFKKQGVYKATLSVTNTLGYSDTTEYLINIGPDLKPVANFTTATTIIRDVEDYGNAIMELQDISYSLDGDIINSRIWTYAFDSDNDGSFTDETYKTFDSGNNIKPILKVTTVGKYHIKLLVKETFTDTLPLYILPADYLSDDTVDKPNAESIIEVINIAPTAAFSMIDKKKVDLVFNVWDTRYTKAEIETKINSTLVPALNANDIDANIKIADNYDMVIEKQTYALVQKAYAGEEYNEIMSTINIPSGYSKFVYNSTNTCVEVSASPYRPPTTAALYVVNTQTNERIEIAYAKSDNYKLQTVGVRFGGVDYFVGPDPTFQGRPPNASFYIDGFVATGNKITITARGYYSTQMSSDSLLFSKTHTFTLPGNINNGDSFKFELRNSVRKRDQDSYLTAHSISYTNGILSKTIDNSKYLNTLLSEQSFRANSQPYVVNISDKELEELVDPIRADKILTQTLEKNVCFVGLGTTANKTQIENYVKSNNNNGNFFNNTNLDTAIASLKDYILSKENQEEPKTQYVVMGEELEYLTFYDDHEDDIKYSELWKYTHTNPSYFDNGLGTDAQSGINRALPITQFNKVGAYDVLFNVQDNPYNNSLFNNYKLWSKDAAMQLIVHRKPIAAFTPYILYNSATSKYYISAVDKSYDLDHSVSRADKGIVQKQWKYKLAEDINWLTGTPSDIVYGKTYQVQLMVQDVEGAWSLPVVETVSVPDILLYANPTSLPWQNKSALVNLSVIVNNGIFNRVDYKWTNDTTRPMTGLISSTNINNNLTQTMTNVWYLHATAYTASGQSAYNYFGPYLIDKIAPTISVDKTNAESIDPITVNVTVGDTGGSGIKEVKYRWTNTIAKPTSGWSITNDCFSTIQEEEGIWYLHVEATDNAGNITYDYFGIYKVDSFLLEKFRVVMVRDVQLEDYYYNNLTGRYDDIPMYVNKMALDDVSFGSVITELTKGYKFEFEIDSRNFNEAADTIIIEPHFYTTDGFARDAAERELYWEDSSHQIFKAGEGGHVSWKTIELAASNRIIRTGREATWRGEYLIPGSAWAVPKGTMKAQARAKDLKKDILVNFQIIGYKDGILKFDYNADQWGKERTTDKYPYLIGDVIRYSWYKNCLDDINAKDNR